MTTCETHEIDLERRAAGRLEAREAAALEAHLATCEACRGYARRLERMGALVRAGNERAESPARRQRISKYALRREARQYARIQRYLPWSLFLGLMTFVLSLWDGPPFGLLFWLGFLGALLFQVVHQVVRQRRLLRLAESSDDLLGLTRQELAARRLLAWAGASFALVFGWLSIGSGLEAPPVWMPTLGLHAPLAVAVGLGLVLWGLALYLLAIMLPSLRREAAQYE